MYMLNLRRLKTKVLFRDATSCNYLSSKRSAKTIVSPFEYRFTLAVDDFLKSAISPSSLNDDRPMTQTSFTYISPRKVARVAIVHS